MVICAHLSRAVFAQDSEFGAIGGRVTDAWQGGPLAGVVVTLRGTTLATTTDSTGAYQLRQVAPGLHVLTLVKPGFTRLTVVDVRVIAGQVSRVESQLKPEFYEMETFEAVSEPVQEQQVQIFEKRQESVVVMDVLGSEMISRLGAGDAAEVVARTTGATIKDGKFAVIRGLSDRYTSANLNGGNIPSADPYRKSAQLDLFPSDLIESVAINKTFTPDQPGDFTGGAVNITTKSFPEEFFFTYSIGTSYNEQASLNPNFTTYPGGSTDYLGFDDGTRAMPDVLANAARAGTLPPFSSGPSARSASLARAFGTTQLAPTRSKSPLNHNFSVATGNRGELLGKEFGFLASMSYDRKFNFYENGEVNRYAPVGAVVLPQLRLRDVRGTEEVSWGTAFNFALRPFDEHHEFGFNFIYTQYAEDEARTLTGRDLKNEPNPTDIFTSSALHYTERNLNSFQFRGKHEFAALRDWKLDWLFSLASTSQDEPDLRFVSLFFDPLANVTGPNNAVFPQVPSRYFRNLTEDNATFRVDNTLPFTTWKDLEGRFKLGAYQSLSTRTYKDQGFALQSGNGYSPWFGNGDPNQLIPIMSATPGNAPFFLEAYPENRYAGEQSVHALYGMVEFPLGEQLKLVGGYRYETTDISVTSQGGTLAAITPPPTSLKQQDLLPALGLIYSPVSNMNVRVNYAETIARPTYREIANVSTFDFAGGDILVGNPALKLSSIKNYDVRWEWFPRPGDLVSISVFMKDLSQPIELAYVTADSDQLTYINRKSALVYGFELENRMKLDLLDPNLERYSIGLNYAWITSETALTPGELAFKRVVNPAAPTTRPLFDQSPYIFNFDLSYDNEASGTSATIAYNLTGERLVAVNNFGDDVYEIPGESLDFSISQKIGRHLKLRLSLKNLLDPATLRTYGPESGGLIYSRYQRGRVYGLSLSAKF